MSRSKNISIILDAGFEHIRKVTKEYELGLVTYYEFNLEVAQATKEIEDLRNDLKF